MAGPPVNAIAECGESTAVNTEMKEGSTQLLHPAAACGARLAKPGFAVAERQNAPEVARHRECRQHFRLVLCN
jgi:hypothetical protein